MRSQANVFITKLRKKIEMFSAFYIYSFSGKSFHSIGRIAIFKNGKDIYPCYFFMGGRFGIQKSGFGIHTLGV